LLKIINYRIEKIIEYGTCRVRETVVNLAVDNRDGDYISINDEIKNDAALAICSLKNLGVENTVMLTVNSRIVAAKITD
jgi:Cd2+/Zn2+-exporting ATPase